MMPTYKNIHYHSLGNDQFVCPTLNFLSEHISNLKENNVVFHSGTKLRGHLNINCVNVVENIVDNDFYQKFIYCAEKAEKIIVHGFWDVNLLKLLTKFPYLIEKIHWIVFGGDLYGFKFDKFNSPLEILKRLVYKNIKYVYCSTEGDFLLLKKNYSCIGSRMEYFTFLYSVGIYNEKYNESYIDNNLKKNNKEKDVTNILVGNSSDPTNQHFEVFDFLHVLNVKKNAKLNIFAPLSYGSSIYRNKVIEYGKKMFNERFIPLTSFLPLDEYEDFLSKIDIAIFNHERQQAMGNILRLLQLGKTVYLKPNQSHSIYFESLGLKFYDINLLKKDGFVFIDRKDALNNNIIIKKIYDHNNLIYQYKKLIQ